MVETLRSATERYNELASLLEMRQAAHTLSYITHQLYKGAWEAAQGEQRTLLEEVRQQGYTFEQVGDEEWVLVPYTLSDLVKQGVLYDYTVTSRVALPGKEDGEGVVVWWFTLAQKTFHGTGIAESEAKAQRELRRELARHW